VRIIVIWPGLTGKFEKLYYNFNKRFIQGYIRLGHSVTEFCDRQTADSFLLNWRTAGVPFANAKLLKLIEAVEPDAIISFHSTVIWKSTFLKAKSRFPNLKIANIDCDPIHIPVRVDRHVQNAEPMDATFATTAGDHIENLRQKGLNAYYVPNPTDASLDDADSCGQNDHQHDLVFFCGNREGTGRWIKYDAIASQLPSHIKASGFGANKKRVFGRNYYNVLRQSKCALNLSSLDDIFLYSSDRMAQLFGAGLCVCMPKSSGFERFLRQDEALFYQDFDSLAKMLPAVVDSGEWRSIARKGRKRYRELFNEMQVADYTLKRLFDEDCQDFEWHDV
jgi:hypothetical protein